jgi:hypothetical protein
VFSNVIDSYHLVDERYSLCRLALFTLCIGAPWWLKRRQPVSALLVASRLNGRRRATLSQNFQKTPQFITYKNLSNGMSSFGDLGRFFETA